MKNLMFIAILTGFVLLYAVGVFLVVNRLDMLRWLQ